MTRDGGAQRSPAGVGSMVRHLPPLACTLDRGGRRGFSPADAHNFLVASRARARDGYRRRRYILKQCVGERLCSERASEPPARLSACLPWQPPACGRLRPEGPCVWRARASRNSAGRCGRARRVARWGFRSRQRCRHGCDRASSLHITATLAQARPRRWCCVRGCGPRRRRSRLLSAPAPACGRSRRQLVLVECTFFAGPRRPPPPADGDADALPHSSPPPTTPSGRRLWPSPDARPSGRRRSNGLRRPLNLRRL